MRARVVVRADASPRDDFADVAGLLRQSILMHTVAAVLRAVVAAVERSRVVAIVRARIEAFAQLGREHCLRNAALFFLTAAVTELVLTGFVPHRSAPALPRAAWALAAVIAAVPVFAPRAVLAAWDNSITRRLGR